MPGVEFLVGVLIVWAVRKARRVGERVDGQVDQVLDAGVDRVGELVSGKLGGDPALVKLEAEAGAGEVSERTRARVALAVEDAADTDPGFAAAVQRELSRLEVAAGGSGAGGVTVLGGVTIKAEGGWVAGFTFTGPLTVGVTPPPPAGAGGTEGEGRGDPPVPGRP